jgi:endonuclease/exonuclease/phosphatase family metal-dependent hydrolase
VSTPNGDVDVANVHLPTARYGLQAVMRGDDGLVPSGAIDAIGTAARTATGSVPDNVDRQLRSSRLARDIASERASLRASAEAGIRPLIVLGDFNLPVESTIYSDHWRHLTNAFEEVGNGLGWTKREGKLLRIRIDHVLTNRLLKPRMVKVGRDWYSDHLPVIVDLERK